MIKTRETKVAAVDVTDKRRAFVVAILSLSGHGLAEVCLINIVSVSAKSFVTRMYGRLSAVRTFLVQRLVHRPVIDEELGHVDAPAA